MIGGRGPGEIPAPDVPVVFLGTAGPLREQVLGPDVVAAVIFRDSPVGVEVSTFCPSRQWAALAAMLRIHADAVERDGGAL